MICKGCGDPVGPSLVRVTAEELQDLGEYPFARRVVTVDAGVFCGWLCLAIYANTRDPHDGDAIHLAGKLEIGREMRAAGVSATDPDEEPF